VPEFKFSISLPVFNSGRLLTRCLESIYTQDYPRELVEVLVVDAGSTDNTLDIARRYPVKVFNNPKRLGEYGMQIAVENASGDLLVLFAADNGLAGNGWLKKVESIFLRHPELSCLWGKMIAESSDPPIMRYYELIQSEPLAQFLNKNLGFYLKNSKDERLGSLNYKTFKVDPKRPLCWGANGIVYRLSDVRNLFSTPGYTGDNEIFQYMVEAGHNQVAYSPDLNIYHHTVNSAWHWVSKWKRNYAQIFLKTRATRRIDWFYYGHFKLKMFFWIIYSLIPIFSITHAIYLMIKDRNIYWLYHSLMCFLQTMTYLFWTVRLPEGRKALIEHMFKINK